MLPRGSRIRMTFTISWFLQRGLRHCRYSKHAEQSTVSKLNKTPLNYKRLSFAAVSILLRYHWISLLISASCGFSSLVHLQTRYLQLPEQFFFLSPDARRIKCYNYTTYRSAKTLNAFPFLEDERTLFPTDMPFSPLLTQGCKVMSTWRVKVKEDR